MRDGKEFQISVQDVSVQPTRIDGYDGLADPARRDLFIEIDAVGGDNLVPYDARQMVVSQFHVHDIGARIDAAFSSSEPGHLGGGQVVPHQETLTMDKLKDEFKDAVACVGSDTRRCFFPERARHFHYGLFSDKVVGEGCFGAGNFHENFPDGKNFIVAHFRAFCAWPDLGHMMAFQYAPILDYDPREWPALLF